MHAANYLSMGRELYSSVRTICITFTKLVQFLGALVFDVLLFRVILE